MTGFLARPRAASLALPQRRAAELAGLGAAAGAAILVLAWLLTISLQVGSAFVLCLLVVGLHQYDRRWGIAAMLGLWLFAPALRRVLALITGHVENDPLSVAPFAATAAIAGLELVQVHVASRLQRIFLLAAGGFAVGVPIGLLMGPRAAVYAFGAYLAGLSGAVLGINEPGRSLGDSTLRKVLLVAMPPIAVYAILQRALPLPEWDQAWMNATDFNSIGASRKDEVRVWATLNSPGTLAPLLSLSLLCYLTVRPKRLSLAAAGAAVLAIALSLTLVRSAWIALIVAGVAHVIVSRGRSARAVFGAAGVAVAVTLALAPVSATARDVLDRFDTIGNLGGDTSANDRSATLSGTLPKALQAPLGHGLGSAGEPSKLTGNSELRAPDNGYLSLIYQVGPFGAVLVLAAVAAMLRAAWSGARSAGPGQELRQLYFAMLVYTVVQLGSGDQFYGVTAVIFWFLGGQVLAYDLLRRREARRRAQSRLALV